MAYDFDSLISCRKIVTKKPKREFFTTDTDKVNLRNEFECVSEDGQHRFLVIMRRNTLTANNFSVMIIFKPDKTNVEIPLLRYNWAQEHNDRITGEKYADFHIHKNEALKANPKTMPATRTKAYFNYETAYEALIKDCNIIFPVDGVLDNQIDLATYTSGMK